MRVARIIMVGLLVAACGAAATPTPRPTSTASPAAPSGTQRNTASPPTSFASPSATARPSPSATNGPPATSSGSSAAPSATALPGTSGRIVFKRLDAPDHTGIYTVNLDGSSVEQVHPGPAEGARWSPDGTQISIFCCDDGMAAHIVDVATGDVRGIPQPDPELETFCGGSWSPDGERLTCGSYGVSDPSLNGIYSLSVSDGGLERITTNPGAEDFAGDYSPDGERLVFVRGDSDGPVGYFVTNVDGSGLTALTPPEMVLDESGFAGRWSPDGSQILIVAHPTEDSHKAIWVVSSDGGSPEQLAITPECGGPLSDPDAIGCYSPDWSPDGEQIVFVRNEGGTGESIYMVNADGTGLVQITDGEDDQPDWGSVTSDT